MADRDMLAQRLLAATQAMRGGGPSWQPGPTAPFGGLEAYDWKNPGQQPQPVGTVPSGPSEEQLKLLHLLGRRRMPSDLSGVGGTF